MALPEGDSGQVVIVSARWQTRALIGAQLKEEGFESVGAGSVAQAYEEVNRLRLKPRLVIIESREVDLPAFYLELLSQACPGAALLVVSGASDHPGTATWPGPVHSLAKPVTIGQIVRKATEIVRG